MAKRIQLLFLFITTLAISACNPTRNVPNGSYLLNKNIIQSDTAGLSKDQFEVLMRQKPNRKLVGFIRFHLWIYNLGTIGKDNKFKGGLRKIGEAPVIVDSASVEKTKEQFKFYLNKNGYFNATVSDTLVTKKKKAKVFYHIHYSQSYTIHSISYSTQDSGMINLLPEFQRTSLLTPGDRFSEELIDKERERVTTGMKDQGYYFFNRNYITFQVDTALGNHQVDIYLYLNRINENVDPNLINYETVKDHQTYRIRNIYIQTDFNQKNSSLSIPTDTLFYKGYYILSASNGYKIKNSELVRNIFVSSGNLYYQPKLDYTYKKLQELNLFKFINIYFKEVPKSDEQVNNLLDLFIQMTPMNRQDFTVESEVTNTGGNLGIAGSFGYRNKNFFKGAEVFEFKIKGGLEAIPNFNDSALNKKFFFFNTYEVGPEVSLGFKKLLLPGFIERTTSRYANPKTTFNLGFNYQERPDYTRTIANFSLNYSISPTKRQRFIFGPEINQVKVKLSPFFQSKLESLNDPRLLYTYDTHIISSLRLSYINSNQNLSLTKSFLYFRVNSEAAGKLFKSSLKPSQFLKLDFDLSYHKSINRFNNIVFRVASGVGLPFGVSRSLPFEKSFFAGGANSVRAWNARTLGPGSYKKVVNIEQSGDIKIEGNIEFRTELIRLSNGIIIEGASFVDAGNVWTRNEDVSRPGGVFEIKNAISQLGVGGGFGLRFNFTFFILRFDAAVKLRDPSLDTNDRWVYPNQKFGISDVNFNLAIGYPF